MHGHFVAAEGIVTMPMTIRIGQFAAVPRAARMVEDDLPVKFFKVHG